MRRSIQSILLGTLVLISIPLAASALTADELRAQVTDLLARIQALQAQIAAQSGGSTATTPPPTSGTAVPAGSCPRIGRILRLGSSGDDVTRLQQFLALDPSVYPERQVTGYYGPLTEAAVKRFQCNNRIVCDGTPDSTGYGVTGPRTAAILALQCPDGGGGGATGAPVSGFIRVTPTTGPSPLSVTVDATVNTARSCAAQVYHIDYGDGSSPGIISVPANRCSELQQIFTHVYTRAGTYQVLLRSGTHQVSATVTVTQGSNIPANPDTISASPRSGSSPLTVTFSGLVNANGVCNAGPYSINFGDGQSANISVAGCTPTSFSVPHTYSTSGTFTARLYRGSPAVNAGSVQISVGGSVSNSGGAFSVAGGINNDPFTMRAIFSIPSSCARYDLDWGDGTARAVQSEGSCAAGSVSRELTHTYANPGSYTITLKRGASLQFTDTASVTIVN